MEKQNDGTEERISEPDERQIEITWSEQQRENRLKTTTTVKEQSLGELRDDKKRSNIHFIGVLGGDEREDGAKNYSKK